MHTNVQQKKLMVTTNYRVKPLIADPMKYSGKILRPNHFFYRKRTFVTAEKWTPLYSRQQMASMP